MRHRIAAAFALLALTAAAASAHVTLQPRESAPNATVTYTIRIPTEGTVTTTGIELEIPDGITVTSVDGPADAYQVKKAGDRITSITWKTEIPPKQVRTFTFSARNPSAPVELSWKAHQHFADGTTFDWVEPAGGKRPAGRPKIAGTADKAPAADEHEHHK